ncbi:hypothetical protein [Luteolibacter sp. Populi]|uniref:hypothetical protein n=1 Tax=Luteolibacter sp. Populi TaxID=3230487 RepID=UPI00346777F4
MIIGLVGGIITGGITGGITLLGYWKKRGAVTEAPVSETRLEDTPTFRRLGFKEVRDSGGCFVSEPVSTSTWRELMKKEEPRDGYVNDASYSDAVDLALAVAGQLGDESGGAVELSVVGEKTLYSALNRGGVSFSSGGVWVKEEEGNLPRFIQVGGPQRLLDDRLSSGMLPSTYGKKPIYILLELKIPKQAPTPRR